jgi:hypothetical protein
MMMLLLERLLLLMMLRSLVFGKAPDGLDLDLDSNKCNKRK